MTTTPYLQAKRQETKYIRKTVNRRNISDNILVGKNPKPNREGLQKDHTWMLGGLSHLKGVVLPRVPFPFTSMSRGMLRALATLERDVRFMGYPWQCQPSALQ